MIPHSLFLRKIIEKKFAFNRFIPYVVSMDKTEKLEQEISILQETLVDCVLTIAERVGIRQEVAELEAELAEAWAEIAMAQADLINDQGLSQG